MSGARTDPSGKQALFSSQVRAAPDRIAPGAVNEGKSALFSARPRTPGTVVVECSRCQLRSRASLTELAVLLLGGSVWLPVLGGRHPHWMRCPGCNHRTWCRIGWSE